jgi:hypothetical protein
MFLPFLHLAEEFWALVLLNSREQSPKTDTETGRSDRYGP